MAGARQGTVYREDPVGVRSGQVHLACSLAVPEGRGPCPAVALLGDTGPQTRDGEILGFGPFQLLADGLARQSIAVLRCDDRGIGGSAGNVDEATAEDFVADALAQVAWLRSQPGIDSGRVGLLGHGEGGLVAALAASRPAAVAFVVLLSAPALPGEQVLIARAEMLSRAAGASEETIARNRALQRQVFQAARTGSGWNEVAAAIRADVARAISALPEAERQVLTDPDSIAAAQVEAQIRTARSPSFRFFLDYDPAPTLEKLKVPVLAVFGELDLEVPAEMSRPAVERACARSKNRGCAVRVLPRANHLYQAATTGGIAEYPVLPHSLVPGLLDLVSRWIATPGNDRSREDRAVRTVW